MTLARRVAQLERRRPLPAPSESDDERVFREHLLHHLSLDEHKDLDQAARHMQDGVLFTEAEDQRVYELLERGRQRMKACPLPWEACRTTRVP